MVSFARCDYAILVSVAFTCIAEPNGKAVTWRLPLVPSSVLGGHLQSQWGYLGHWYLDPIEARESIRRDGFGYLFIAGVIAAFRDQRSGHLDTVTRSLGITAMLMKLSG